MTTNILKFDLRCNRVIQALYHASVMPVLFMRYARPALYACVMPALYLRYTRICIRMYDCLIWDEICKLQIL